MTELPEGDAIEQAIPLDPDDDEPELPVIGDEVPEADAVEQAIPVPLGEDEYN